MLQASVIIPFFGDVSLLMKCLGSIKKLSLGAEHFEVIIVDNHDQPKLTREDFLPYRVVHQPIPGSYAARNIGIREAKGEFLFFTDADTTVDPHWLEAGLEFLKDHPCCLVGGKIELVFENEKKVTSLEHYEKVFYFQQKLYVEKEGYAATANLFAARELFIENNGFDSSLRSGGDQEFCHRVGNSLHFCDKAIVYHPSRSRLKSFLIRRLRAFSGNLYLFYRQHGLNWQMTKQKLRYFLNTKNFRHWNGDWEYFDLLDEGQQKKVLLWHRFMCWVDVLTLIYCKTSYRRMKKMTLIDRR